MKFDKKCLVLYAVTDRRWLQGETLAHQVELAIQGGASCIQLREKEMDIASFIDSAKEIKKITDRYKIPLIINDNITVCMAVNADGVHVGQEDMDVGKVRSMIGPDKILGVSAKTVKDALYAKEHGTDYIGIGAVFSTSTKPDASTVDYNTLCHVCSSVDIPFVAIGGITAENALELRGSHIDGIAVVSAVFAQKDIKSAAQHLKQIACEVIN